MNFCQNISLFLLLISILLVGIGSFLVLRAFILPVEDSFRHRRNRSIMIRGFCGVILVFVGGIGLISYYQSIFSKNNPADAPQGKSQFIEKIPDNV